jgi:hypothetical protein
VKASSPRKRRNCDIGSETGYAANQTWRTFRARSSAATSATDSEKSRRSAKKTASVPRIPKTGGVASAPFVPIDWNRYAPKAGKRWKNSGTTRALARSRGNPMNRAGFSRKRKKSGTASSGMLRTRGSVTINPPVRPMRAIAAT